MNAQIVPINPELISTIVFPEDFHTQITIPANAIIYQRSTEGVHACKLVCAMCMCLCACMGEYLLVFV